MSHIDNYNYESTFTENLTILQDKLKDKNIIYFVQYIQDEETQIDKDGPQSWWSVEFLCIEKTEDDYIFHTFNSGPIHAYSYSYFVRLIKDEPDSIKLSSLDNEADKLINEADNNEISKFIWLWKLSYSHALKSKDEDFIKKLTKLSHKIDCLEKIYNDKIKEDIKKKEEQYQKYLESDEYKEAQKEISKYHKEKEDLYAKGEQERLKKCIELYGEVDGYKFWQRL